ncbi:MAG: PspC domain-containing protein [Bdellovibrionaceae bacterium]|jgi:phage shock protein C|nr:PspC domain-containing protein [Pseudobdellovibrionaceae bacterium]
MNEYSVRPQTKWLRSKDGLIAGVCTGVAEVLGVDLLIVRLLWLASVLFLGAGLWLYIGLAISLPREDRLNQAWQPMLLGVSKKIAYKTSLEIGMVRFFTLCLAVMSFGFTALLYVLLYFLMPDPHDLRNVN